MHIQRRLTACVRQRHTGSCTRRDCRRGYAAVQKPLPTDEKWASTVTRDWDLKAQPAAMVPSTQVLGQQPTHGKRPRWTEDEERIFQQKLISWVLINKPSKKIDWDAVAQHIVGRKPSAIYSRFKQTMYSLQMSRRTMLIGNRASTEGDGFADSKEAERREERKAVRESGTRWTLEEDDALRTAVALYGARKWKLIAEFVETRRYLQCYTRWGYLNSPLSGKQAPPSYWANVAHRNAKLRRFAAGIGARGNGEGGEAVDNSSVVEAILSQHRMVIQDGAVERGGSNDEYKSTVSGVFKDLRLASSDGDERLPNVERSLLVPFTVEEDKMIISLVRLHGRKWTHIARLVSCASQKQGKGRDSGGTERRPQRRTAKWVRIRYEQLVNPIASQAPKPNSHSPAKPAEPGSQTAGQGSAEDKAAVEASDADIAAALRSDLAAGSGSGKRQKEPSSKWTAAEDEELTRIVESHLQSDSGFLSWAIVANQMSTGRSATQCSGRWTQTIGTHLKHTPFSKAEDETVWPFVLDGYRRSLLSTPREDAKGKKTSDAVERLINGTSPPTIGVGWLSAKLRSTRSTHMLVARIRRLRHTIEWLDRVAGVEDPHTQVDLVRRLANTPSDFRIIAKDAAQQQPN